MKRSTQYDYDFVPDMMCENYVKRITNALTAAELKFSVSLDTKTDCHHRRL